jgi:hypothetical protein
VHPSCQTLGITTRPEMSRTFDPVCKCIYCASEDELTDEHVVPLGLGGDLILPKSSCKSCNTLTSKFELNVLRGHMNDARSVGNLPSRRKKNRPTSIATTLIQLDESTTHLDVPVAQALGFLVMPIFEPASFVYGPGPGVGARITTIETLKFGPDFEAFLIDRNAVGISGKVRIDVVSFTKFLAKIAYSYYVGVNGQFPIAESPALALLLGRIDNPSNWIGTTFLPIASSKSTALHALATKSFSMPNGASLELVQIQLFSAAKSCTYEVVVRATNWQAYSAQTSDA